MALPAVRSGSGSAPFVMHDVTGKLMPKYYVEHPAALGTKSKEYVKERLVVMVIGPNTLFFLSATVSAVVVEQYGRSGTRRTWLRRRSWTQVLVRQETGRIRRRWECRRHCRRRPKQVSPTLRRVAAEADGGGTATRSLRRIKTMSAVSIAMSVPLPMAMPRSALRERRCVIPGRLQPWRRFCSPFGGLSLSPSGTSRHHRSSRRPGHSLSGFSVVSRHHDHFKPNAFMAETALAVGSITSATAMIPAGSVSAYPAMNNGVFPASGIVVFGKLPYSSRIGQEPGVPASQARHRVLSSSTARPGMVEPLGGQSDKARAFRQARTMASPKGCARFPLQWTRPLKKVASTSPNYRSVTWAFLGQSVPVFVDMMVFTLWAISRASPLLIKMPSSCSCRFPTMMAVGVANPRAQDR